MRNFFLLDSHFETPSIFHKCLGSGISYIHCKILHKNQEIVFFYFLKWQKQFSQSISYWMRISSANLLHLGPPSTACAVLHPYILLATDAFPLWTAFRHPLISSPPQAAVFQTCLYLISQCTGWQHFWLFALITNTAFLTSHTTILRHRMWKKFSSAEGLNSQVRRTRKKMPSFCSCNL